MQRSVFVANGMVSIIATKQIWETSFVCVKPQHLLIAYFSKNIGSVLKATSF